MLSVIFLILYLAGEVNLTGGNPNIGLCYGMEGDNFPSPREVISIYKSNRVKKIRLYEPNDTVFRALRKTKIDVLVGIRNEHIQEIALSYGSAERWVQENIIPYWPEVQFLYVAVGNEAIPGPYALYVLPAMRNLHAMIRNYNQLANISVSTVISTTMFRFTNPPSTCTFPRPLRKLMKDIAEYLTMTEAPLLANIHPYLRYVKDPNRTPLPYSMFLPSQYAIRDGLLAYLNLFDEMFDALYASLREVGGTDIPIVVAEIGWPLAGNSPVATARHARHFLSHLVQHVSSSRGTPAYKRRIETYIYAILDENKRSGMVEGEAWGLLRNGMKLAINFSSFEFK